MTDFPTWEEMERFYIERTMNACEYNVTAAAKLSGIARATFYRRVKAYSVQSLSSRRAEARQAAARELEALWAQKRGQLRVV